MNYIFLHITIVFSVASIVISAENRLCYGEICVCVTHPYGFKEIKCENKYIKQSLPSPSDMQWPPDYTSVNFVGVPWNHLEKFSAGEYITHIKLDGNGLKSIAPSAFSDFNLIKLEIYNNNLTHLSDSLKGLDQVVELFLTNNDLVEITEKNLEDLKSLDNLHIQNNQLTFFSTSAIDHLKNLKDLNLSGNRIFSIQFSLSRLQFLNLAKNKISRIFKTTFENSSIATLDLSHNDITSIEDGSFLSCVNLSYVDLSYNKLKVTPDLPENPQYNLYLSHNEISSWNKVPSEITYIDISYNKLKSFPNQHLNKLWELNATHNEMDELSIDSPDSFPDMTRLDISFNKFENIPISLNSSNFPALAVLNIGGNLFSSLKFNAELKLAKLHASYLERIIEIKEDDLTLVKRHLEDCFWLKISHCPNLAIIEDGSFKKEPLCQLDLSHNNLQGLSIGVVNWEDINNGFEDEEQIKLEGNPWDCDCKLQPLLENVYKKNSFLMDQPRCETPNQFNGLQLSTWYQISDKVFCNDTFTEKSNYTKYCADPSVTTINDGRLTCKGEVIFYENFNDASLDTSKWIIEQRLPPEDQENEFVSYQKISVSLSNKKLMITPYWLSKIFPYNHGAILSGTLDLTEECTALSEISCKYDAFSADILPPVVSGKISTRNLFAFKYGKIEIRAKLPIGDWLYPELFLEPSRQLYGISGYESGQMRVAFARGNKNLINGTNRIDNSLLSGGIMLGVFGDCRTVEMKTIYHNESLWGNDFHTYTILWKPESIEMLVDNISYGKILPGFKDHYKNNICPSLNTTSRNWSSGSSMAPYDEEFYISIGLGAGGISDFPDNVGKKPWKNKSRKALYDFYSYGETWYNFLEHDNKSLYVESIKVTAL